MRIFWWQRGLHIEPEDIHEAKKLREMVENCKWGMKPEHAVQHNDGGQTQQSESQELLAGQE